MKNDLWTGNLILRNSLKHKVLKRKNNSERTYNLRVMTCEEFETFNDPAPGTDRGWDTMSESDKCMFRNMERSPHQPGQTLSELLKDRDALNGEVLKKIPKTMTVTYVGVGFVFEGIIHRRLDDLYLKHKSDFSSMNVVKGDEETVSYWNKQCGFIE